jgi:hypothetical protein
MRKTFHRHSWRRVILLAAVVTSGLLASAIEARAVILCDSASRNTDAPLENQGLAGWNLEATWGSFLATPIDPTHFICAKHITSPASTITFQGSTYTVNMVSRQEDSHSDLCIYSLSSGTFPTYAPLYNESIDGSATGKTLTVFGKGVYQRGAEVTLNSTLLGWKWDSASGSESWGQNIVTGPMDYVDSHGNVLGTDTLLYFNFDADSPVANEAALVVNDSSGGVFIQGANGQWKLAGVNYGVSGPFSLTGQGTAGDGFNASLFDTRGVYEWDSITNKWLLHDPNKPNEPGLSACSSISAELAWIQGIAPQVIVPEPGAVALLLSAALSLAAFRRLARRRKAL